MRSQARESGWGWVVAGIVLFGALAAPRPVLAQATSNVDEFTLKAAFLFNFTRFVRWPDSTFESADSPFRICVAGTDPFGARLDALAERRVGERRIEIDRPSEAAALRRCQIIYLGDAAPALLSAKALSNEAATSLTVSSEARFAREGGMIALVTNGGRVRLHVNLDSLRKSKLQVSAKLLEVAERRYDETGR